MYDPLPKVVWVANRERPLTDSAGTLAISEDGNLVVLNGKKQTLWSSTVSESVKNSTTAQLLDTGSLILKDSSGRTIWESFQVPTDTLLQGMNLSAKWNLSSWRNQSDPAIGNFMLGFVPLPTPQIFIWNKKKPFWRSGPWSGKTFIGVLEMDGRYKNGYEVIDAGSESAYFTFTLANDRIPAFYFFQLTPRGALEVPYWEPGNSEWELDWSSNNNQCNLYGMCGPFGICNPQVTGNQICTCLPEFEPKDKEEWERGNWTAGCTRKKPLLLCDKNNSVGQHEIKKLTNVKVPDSAMLEDCTEEDCDTCCLENCSCIAFAYAIGVGCMLWNDSLVDIQQFSRGGVDLYIRVAQSENKKWNLTAVVVSTVVIGVLILAVSAYIFWKYYAKHRGRKQDIKMSLFQDGDWTETTPNNKLKQGALEELPLYSYETIADATDNFSSASKLGIGGFGQVYKGKLLDGLEIAVKRLSRSSCQGTEEFMNEVVAISKLQHRNLVRPLGCSVEREEKMLIYEHMPNRNLDAFLFDSLRRDLLDWTKRALIIEGIGRGLLYLHRDSRLKIIHRDLKASNILLDENLNPKISDFGLARIVGGNQDEADTRRVVGTYGYMAPEYAMEGIFSEKSDVFGFGVLLLEIVSGRRNTSFSHAENGQSLLKYAWQLWSEGEAVKLIDPSSIFDTRIAPEILKYIHVGLLCVQEFARDRPNVSAILSMLNSEISDLPHPKQSAFTERVTSSDSEFSQRSAHSVNVVSITALEPR